MVAKKPRVVIIGAGMAGLSAASQLIQTGASSFDLTILEASNRIGGRIITSQIGGDRVELGATWIHGMEGSPLYKIAQEIGATERTTPFERQDGFPATPIVKAEGGLTLPPSIVTPIMDLYKKLLDHIRSHESLSSTLTPLSIGTFVAQSFDAFLSQQINTSQLEDVLFDCLSNDGLLSWSNYTSPWTLRSLQEALISMNEYMERVDTSADTLYDLDLRAEKEYTDYPGEHVTIAGGYTSIINEVAAAIPAKLIQFGKKVDQIVWNRATQCCGLPVVIHCSDGSFYEADHVIVTVSLGVLKAGAVRDKTYPWASPEGRFVCRSVTDLQIGKIAKKEARNPSLFEPPLPACKEEAISRLGYGLVNKVFLQLNTSALSSSQLQQLNSHIQLVYKECGDLKNAAIPRWMRKTFSMSPIYNGSTVLLCWFAGSEALEIESLSDEEIMSGVAQTLATFGVAREHTGMKRSPRKSRDCESSSCSDSEDSVSRGEFHSSTSSSDSEENFDEDEGELCTREEDFRRMFCGVLRSKWGRNPLFHGSYSFVATGSSGDDIEKLAEPLPALARGEAFDANVGAFNAIVGGKQTEAAAAGALKDGNDAMNASGDNCNANSGTFNANGETFNVKDGALMAKEGMLGGIEGFGSNLGGSGDDDDDDDTGDQACNNVSYKNQHVGGEAPLQLLFAGEATVRVLYSTTHGAHLSGLREANRLLHHYGFSHVAPL